MSAVTQWFGMKVAPVNTGVYEVRGFEFQLFSRWNGKFWCDCGVSTQAASWPQTRSLWCYGARIKGWRGLANNPKAAQ